MLFLLFACSPCAEEIGSLEFLLSSTPPRDDLRGVVVYVSQLEPEPWDVPLQIPVDAAGGASIDLDAGRYEYWAAGTTAESISFESSSDELALEACEEADVEIMVYALFSD